MFDKPLPPPGSRAILLGRFSDSHQNPMSADDQIAVLRADCERHGWVVVGEFQDKAKSGRSVARRTGYLDAMAAAEAGLADVICVFHLDRLGRNARELHHANYRLKDANVVIYTHDKGVMSRMEFSLFAEIAEMESEKIAERTTRGRLAAAMRGKIMGEPPYGFHHVNKLDESGNPKLNSRGAHIKRLEIDPVTSRVVLRVNEDFDAGKSPHQIAVELTKEGIPTPEGGKMWHPNTIIGVSRSMSGLLRNPIIVGKVIHGKVKTSYDEKTGRVTRRKNDVADRIEHDAPWLRIVPQDIWDRNQERLSRRPPSKLRDRRRPTYLLSGLVRCGMCGGPFNQVATNMGCTAHRMKACANARRVRREALEQVVLEGLAQRLSRPSIVEWFIPEYLREQGPARAEGGDRYERSKLRLGEVEREINNLISQAKSGASGYAAALINDNLNTLGAEKDRLDREMRAGPPAAPASLTTEVLTQRIAVLLQNLGVALTGDERDATRAKAILRGLISKITVSPYDAEGRRPDGRGAGAVRVMVEGEISRLVDHAMLDRKIMHGRGAEDVHGLPIATFRFWVDLHQTLTAEEEGIWRDAAIIARLLDDADRPLPFSEMISAFNDRGREPTALEVKLDETRARIALAQFRRDGSVRSIRLGQTNRGWVWNDRDLTDEQWRALYEQQTSSRPPRFSGAYAQATFEPIRASAPEADVTVVGSGAIT